MSDCIRETQLLFHRWSRCGVKHLFVLSALMSLTAWAQQPLIPAELGTTPLTGDAASSRSNTLLYGVNIAGAFDDNATNLKSAGRQTNIISSVQPQAALALKRGHLNSSFTYSAGFTYSSD